MFFGFVYDILFNLENRLLPFEIEKPTAVPLTKE
jgi:hypothetical protein